MIHHQEEIKISVGLDENRVPETLHWTASDGGVHHQSAKAMLLSLWSAKEKETLRVHLWTKDMTIDEMKHFFHQTLLEMSQTFEKATSDEKMALTMRDFCDYFAEKMEIIQK